MFGLRIFGKALEISGKIAQAEGVAEYLEARGQRFAEDVTVAMGGKVLGGRKLQREFLKEFKMPLADRPFAAKVDSTFGNFLSSCGQACNVFHSAVSGWSDAVFMMPRFALDPIGCLHVKEDIAKSAAFRRLYPLEVLQSYFLARLERALCTRVTAERPSVERPLHLNEHFHIVSLDEKAHWSTGVDRGTYYIARADWQEIGRPERRLLADRIEQLDRLRGEATQESVDDSLKTYTWLREYVGAQQDWHALEMGAIGLRLHMPFTLARDA